MQCYQLGTKCKKSSCHLFCLHPPSAPASVPGNLGAQYERSSSAWMGTTLSEFRVCLKCSSRLCSWVYPLERKQVLLFLLSHDTELEGAFYSMEKTLWEPVYQSHLLQSLFSTSHYILILCLKLFVMLLWQTTVFVGYWFYRGDFYIHDHYKNEWYVQYSKSCVYFHAGFKLCLQFSYSVLTIISVISYTL